MKRICFIFSLVLVAISVIYVVNYGNIQSEKYITNPRYNEKVERVDLENTHKIITDEEELRKIAKKENLERIPIRIETEYSGPKD